MNRKQEMVSELAERIIKAKIKLPQGMQESAGEGFWERCPLGHCNRQDIPSLEGKLSCLTESQLRAILKAGGNAIKGDSFEEMWFIWGDEGLLKTTPKLIDFQGRVAFRVRHDMYLLCSNSMNFLSCKDGYSNGVNSMSDASMSRARSICHLSKYADNYSPEMALSWGREYNVFRNAMMLSYAFEPCAKQHSFVRTITENAEEFDKFFEYATIENLRMQLDPALGVEALRSIVEKALPLVSATKLWVPLAVSRPVANGRKEKVFAALHFGETFVRLVGQRSSIGPYSMAVNFPRWEDTYAVRGLRDKDVEDYQKYPAQREYIQLCWKRLARTLLTLAGVRISSEQFYSTKFSTITALLFEADKVAFNLVELDDAIDVYAICYPDEEMLKRWSGIKG